MRPPDQIRVRSPVKRFAMTLSMCACLAAISMPAMAQQAPAAAAEFTLGTFSPRSPEALALEERGGKSRLVLIAGVVVAANFVSNVGLARLGPKVVVPTGLLLAAAARWGAVSGWRSRPRRGRN